MNELWSKHSPAKTLYIEPESKTAILPNVGKSLWFELIRWCIVKREYLLLIWLSLSSFSTNCYLGSEKWMHQQWHTVSGRTQQAVRHSKSASAVGLVGSALLVQNCACSTPWRDSLKADATSIQHFVHKSETLKFCPLSTIWHGCYWIFGTNRSSFWTNTETNTNTYFFFFLTSLARKFQALSIWMKLKILHLLHYHKNFLALLCCFHCPPKTLQSGWLIL